MFIEFTEFIRENVSIGHKIKMLFAKSFLHSDNVETKSVLPGDLMALREMINFLVLIQALIEVAFATGRAPQKVPFMRLCGCKTCSFKHRSNKFIIESRHFVQKFTIFDVIALLITIKLHGICNHLFL